MDAERVSVFVTGADFVAVRVLDAVLVSEGDRDCRCDPVPVGEVVLV